MDLWSSEVQRHKRSFEEMSHAATLSPSPIQFRPPPSSNSDFFNFHHNRVAPTNNNQPSLLERRPSTLERRRTSHPYNPPLLHRSDRSESAMPDRASQPPHRPRLEHQASQTIIDLTDDADDVRPALRNHGDRGRSQRPPQLGRSDALNLGDFIDLTEDSGEPDLIITGGRALPRRANPPPPPAQPNRQPERQDSPGLFVPAGPRIQQVFSGMRNIFVGGGMFGGAVADVHAHINFHAGGAHDFLNHIHMGQQDNFQALPGRMDYRQPAFANQRPEHVAPPAAKTGFTRSPKEDDVIICPSCEQELIHTKDTDEPIVKRGGKVPSRKDREEHPFWVVKECGHVYCNNCFQHRGPPGKYGLVSFPETTKYNGKRPGKTIGCSVEDCDSDVKGKDKWVGVFL